MSLKPPFGSTSSVESMTAGALDERLDDIEARSYTVIAGSGGVAVTDDALVQAAINAYANDGVVILDGQFTTWTATVTLPSGTRLRFTPGSKIVPTAACTSSVFKNAGYAAAEGSAVGNDDITIEDCEIDGNKAARAATATGHLLDFRGGSADPCLRVKLIRPHVYNSPELGIVFQNVQHSLIEKPVVHDNDRDGITLYWNTQHVVIDQPHVYDCADDLIGLNAEVGSGTGHTLSDITINQPDLHGQTTQGSGIAIRGVARVKVNQPIITSAFSAGITITNFNTTATDDVTIQSPTIKNAGASNSGGSGHGIEISAGDALVDDGGTATVSNVRILDMHVTNPRAQGVVVKGISGVVASHITLTGKIECGSLYASGRGLQVTDGYVEDLTVDLNISGAQLGGGRFTGTGLKRITVKGGRIADNGNGTGAAGLSFDGVEDLIVRDVVATDTRAGGSKTQTYGVTVANPSGRLIVQGNDCRGNATGTINITQGASAASQVIRDNMDYDPRSGTATVNGALSNTALDIEVPSGTPTTKKKFYREVAVTFTVPFPTGYTPRVWATPIGALDMKPIVYNPTNTGFTLRNDGDRSDLGSIETAWFAA